MKKVYLLSRHQSPCQSFALNSAPDEYNIMYTYQVNYLGVKISRAGKWVSVNLRAYVVVYGGANIMCVW